MDCDDFARATQRARKVADAFAEAIDGRGWDCSAPAVFLDGLMDAAGGVSSFASVIPILDRPLLCRMSPETVLNELSVVPCETVLDSLMIRSAERAVLRGNADPQSVAQEFCTSVLERYAVDAQRALVETRGGRWVAEHHDELRGLMRPYTEAAARILVANPSARRLGLTARFKVSAVDNLL